MNTTIKREDLDRGAVDFSDVVSGRRLPLVHPGEILRDDFLTPMKCSVYRLAPGHQGFASKVERSRARPPRRHNRHRTAPGALFRNNAGVLDQSPDPLRSRRCRTHRARQDRAVRRVNKGQVPARQAQHDHHRLALNLTKK